VCWIGPKKSLFLASHLRISQYSVLDYSDGGAYALICTVASPKEELKGVEVVAGFALPDVGMQGMPRGFKAAIWSTTRFP
jgi:hypothetical protein